MSNPGYFTKYGDEVPVLSIYSEEEVRTISNYFSELWLEFNIFIIIIKKARQCKAEREIHTLSVRKAPTPQYQPIDREKKKGKVEHYSRDRAAEAIKKALALLLKPESPTPSNTWLARSFRRDTERGRKVLRY